jgi:hypothetical protein
VSNIEQWTSAFQIFVAIYTAKYPAEAPALMKYGEVVRGLAEKGANWNYYDTNFRYLKQKQPQNLPWGSMHFELWLRSQQPQSNLPKLATTRNIQNRPAYIPNGYCRKYHKGGQCGGCAYKHECHKCNNIHPSIKCNFRAPRFEKSKPTTRGTAAKPPNTYPSQSK